MPALCQQGSPAVVKPQDSCGVRARLRSPVASVTQCEAADVGCAPRGNAHIKLKSAEKTEGNERGGKRGGKKRARVETSLQMSEHYTLPASI